jgi:hypothetical protein
MTTHPFKLQSVVLAAANAQNEATSQCATRSSTPRTLEAGLQARFFSSTALLYTYRPGRRFFLQSLPLLASSIKSNQLPTFKMVSKPFQTDALNGLCSKDQLELLESIDCLRSQGISHYVSLPQIIVCGDQSSGKSSVLEAISGVSFLLRATYAPDFRQNWSSARHHTSA